MAQMEFYFELQMCIIQIGKLDKHGGLIPCALLSYLRSHPRILKICTNRTAYLLVLHVKVACSYAPFQPKSECYLCHFHPCLKIPCAVFKLSNLAHYQLSAT